MAVTPRPYRPWWVEPGRRPAARTDEETLVSRPPAPRDDDQSLTIDCDECAMQGTSACGDCVVTFICNREPDEAVIIDVAEARSVRMLAEAGLVPALRHQPRSC